MFLKLNFYKYVCNFDMKKEHIHVKYFHSLRVMKLQEKYAKKLGWNKADIKLAKIIGLLHDIGRFEQYKTYKTFEDSKSTNHAVLGVKILFEDNLIRKFFKNEKDYEIVKFAILNHNKFAIEKHNDERFIKHAKLIRDTDKVDIFYVLGYLNCFENEIKMDNSKPNPTIIKNIFRHKLTNFKDVKTNNDELLSSFCYAFDLNYDIVTEEFKQNFDLYYKRIAEDDTFASLYEEVSNYLMGRIKNVRQKI